MEVASSQKQALILLSLLFLGHCRLLAREGINAEQLARDLKSFELKVTFFLFYISSELILLIMCFKDYFVYWCVLLRDKKVQYVSK